MDTHAQSKAPAPAGQPVRIEPDAWYTDADLRLILRVPGATLRRARQTGELRHRRRGITAWHRGAWVVGHARCSTEAVTRAMGLRLADLMPAKTPTASTPTRRPATKTKPAPTATAARVFATPADAVAELERQHGPRSALWTYHNADREPVGVIARWNLPNGEKDIRPVAKTPDGWCIGRMPEPRPLYHLPELLPHLCEAFEAAEPGSEHVITRCRDGSVNLRTQLERMIRRAGLQPWPKLFRHLRATRETELAERFPLHVVCVWIGNSPTIAAKHYPQATDEHFAAALVEPQQPIKAEAAQNPAQQPHAAGRTASHEEAGKPKNPAICGASQGTAAGRDGNRSVPPAWLRSRPSATRMSDGLPCCCVAAPASCDQRRRPEAAAQGPHRLRQIVHDRTPHQLQRLHRRHDPLHEPADPYAVRALALLPPHHRRPKHPLRMIVRRLDPPDRREGLQRRIQVQHVLTEAAGSLRLQTHPPLQQLADLFPHRLQPSRQRLPLDLSGPELVP